LGAKFSRKKRLMSFPFWFNLSQPRSYTYLPGLSQNLRHSNWPVQSKGETRALERTIGLRSLMWPKTTKK
jgi:hypothetical protein